MPDLHTASAPADAGAALQAAAQAAEARLAEVITKHEILWDALVSCVVRLDDLNEFNGPTATYARDALKRGRL
jgi:hypothetical protein